MSIVNNVTMHDHTDIIFKSGDFLWVKAVNACDQQEPFERICIARSFPQAKVYCGFLLK